MQRLESFGDDATFWSHGAGPVNEPSPKCLDIDGLATGWSSTAGIVLARPRSDRLPRFTSEVMFR